MPCHTRMKIILQSGLLLLYLLGFGVIATSIEPGFLDFDNLPDTNFTCVGKVIGGYYADLETSCQMFHVCTIGQLDEPMDIRFLCLNGTVFDQETRVCERIDEVDCSKSEQFYSLNLELYGNTQPPIVEDSAETEAPDYYKRSSTTTSSTTAIPHSTKAKTTRQSFIITTTVKPSTTTTETTAVKSPQLTGTNAADIRFNPEEINISLNPGALPNIRTKQPISYQQTFSDNNKRLTVTTHTDTYKNEPIIHITSPSPTIKAEATQKFEDSQHHDTESQENYYHHTFNSDYTPELSKNQQYQYRHNVPNFRPSSRDVNSYLPKEYKPSTFRSIYHPTTNSPIKNNYNNRGPTTYRNHGYSQQLKSSQQYYIRTEKPPRIQIPLPLLPTISPITFSSPAPFSLSKHTDVKRYSDHHPRIVISASASVSDASGRKFNYSLGTIGDSRFFEPAPTSYDDYKEADVSLDPFYHDVPKLRRYRRNSLKKIPRSTRTLKTKNKSMKLHRRKRSNRDAQQIFRDEKEAIDILRFLFEWYKLNGNEKGEDGRDMSPEDMSEIRKQIRYLQTLDETQMNTFDEKLKVMEQEIQNENRRNQEAKQKKIFDDLKELHSPTEKSPNMRIHQTSTSRVILNNDDSVRSLKEGISKEKVNTAEELNDNNERFVIILKSQDEENLGQNNEFTNTHNISKGEFSENEEIPDYDLTNNESSFGNHNFEQIQSTTRKSENSQLTNVRKPEKLPAAIDTYDYVDDNYEPQVYVDSYNVTANTSESQRINPEITEVSTEKYKKVLKILGVTTNKPKTAESQTSPNYYYEDSIKTTSDELSYYDYDVQPNLENRNFEVDPTTVKFEETTKAEENLPTTAETLSTIFEAPITVNENYPTTKASTRSDSSENNVFRGEAHKTTKEYSKIKNKSTDDFSPDYSPKPTKSARVRSRGSKKFSLSYNQGYQITTVLPRTTDPKSLVTVPTDLDEESSDLQATTNLANFDFVTEFTENTPTKVAPVIPDVSKSYDYTTTLQYDEEYLTTTTEINTEEIDINRKIIGFKDSTIKYDNTIIVPTTSPINDGITNGPKGHNMDESTKATLLEENYPEATLNTEEPEETSTSLFRDDNSSSNEIKITTGVDWTTTERPENPSTAYFEKEAMFTDKIPINSSEQTTEVVGNTMRFEELTLKSSSDESSTSYLVRDMDTTLVTEKIPTNKVDVKTSSENVKTTTPTSFSTPAEMTTNIDNFITAPETKVTKISENKRKGPKYYENFSKEIVEAIKTKMTKLDKTNKTKSVSKNKIEFNINAYTANLAYQTRLYENPDPPVTDPPLSKSANPTLGKKPKDFLATTPLTKSITVNINRQHFNKTYRFNCFDKVVNRFYSDPRDCRLFHYCTRGYTKTQLLDMKFVCDSGTFFDDVRLICTKEKPKRCL